MRYRRATVDYSSVFDLRVARFRPRLRSSVREASKRMPASREKSSSSACISVIHLSFSPASSAMAFLCAAASSPAQLYRSAPGPLTVCASRSGAGSRKVLAARPRRCVRTELGIVRVAGAVRRGLVECGVQLEESLESDSGDDAWITRSMISSAGGAVAPGRAPPRRGEVARRRRRRRRGRIDFQCAAFSASGFGAHKTLFVLRPATGGHLTVLAPPGATSLSFALVTRSSAHCRLGERKSGIVSRAIGRPPGS